MEYSHFGRKPPCSPHHRCRRHQTMAVHYPGTFASGSTPGVPELERRAAVSASTPGEPTPPGFSIDVAVLNIGLWQTNADKIPKGNFFKARGDGTLNTRHDDMTRHRGRGTAHQKQNQVRKHILFVRKNPKICSEGCASTPAPRRESFLFSKFHRRVVLRRQLRTYRTHARVSARRASA